MLDIVTINAAYEHVGLVRNPVRVAVRQVVFKQLLPFAYIVEWRIGFESKELIQCMHCVTLRICYLGFLN